MSRNAVDVLLVQLEDLVDPLVDIAVAEDPLAVLRRMLGASGWYITEEIDPAPIVDAIDAVLAGIDAARDGVDADDIAAFATALAAIGDLVGSVESLLVLIADGGPATPTPSEAAAFGEDVFGWLLVRWVQRRGALGDVAGLLGLVVPVDVTSMQLGGWLERPAGRHLRVRFQALLDLLSDPAGHLLGQVAPDGWDSSADPAGTNVFLANALALLLGRVGGAWRPHPDAMASPDDLVTNGRLALLDVAMPVADGAGRVGFGTEIELFSAADTDHAGRSGPGVALAPFGGYQHTFDFTDWSLTVGAAVLLGGVDAGDSPPALWIGGDGVEVAPSVDARLDVGAHFELETVLGGKGSRLQLGTIDIEVFGAVEGGEGDVGFSVVASGSKIVLSAADLGDAVAAVAQFEHEIEFDLGIEWSLRGGLRLAGGASLEVVFSEGVDIGGVVSLSGLRLRAELADSFALSAVTDATISLGPVALAFEGLGLGIDLAFPPHGGNLGVADLSLAVEPPKGIGVRVDAGVVSGGGYLYLDPERGEYAGVLELSFPALSLSLKAVGIFTTNLPGGAEGYALLLLIYTEFPAIQLPYGFTLDGVGGVLGLQHGISTTALQAGLRTGALDRVLFPDDPVANAPTLLADLRAIFPITPGALTFGPVLQIGWGAGIVKLSLGLVLQFDNVIGSGGGDPTITRIVLLGQLKVQLPPVDGAPELVKLLVDIVGSYELGEYELSIDARLRDSHIAGLPLTGSLTVRARFGARPTFVLAVGGFHPRFTDIPPGVPAQDRLGIQLRHDIVTVQIVCYTAITSNSFQFGAEASLVAAAGDFRIDAYLGFDTLFHFEPRFHFEVDFRVGAAIRWKDWDLAAVRVAGRLTGPGAWRVTGAASFTVLLWDVEIDFDVAWGHAPLEPASAAPVLPRVIEALSHSDNWHSSVPGGRPLVTLRQLDDATAPGVIAHPLGQLQVQQKIVPFGVTVDRVGRTTPSDHRRFDLTAVQVGGHSVAFTRTREHFARGEFLDLTDDQELTSPSFERFDAGAAIGTDHYVAPVAAAVEFEPEYETGYLEAPEVRDVVRIDGGFLLEHAHLGAAARSLLRRVPKLAGGHTVDISVADPGYTVADPVSLVEVGHARHVGEVLTFTEAAESARARPGALLVVEAVEMGVGP
ncbi:MAG: hypothetical protein JJE52_15435 [Acidimicrobiia bacterium]|nr:hypothetical protein [Acidimicrobiia bacterium]